MGKVFAKDTTNEPTLSIKSRVQTCSEEVNQVVDVTRCSHKFAPFARQEPWLMSAIEMLRQSRR